MVSEVYQFSELVVLAKFAKCTFDGEARPGDVLRYQATIEQAKDVGASVTVTGDLDGRPLSEAEIFFARFDRRLLRTNQGPPAVRPGRPAELAARGRRVRRRRPPGRHPPPRRRLQFAFDQLLSHAIDSGT